MRSRLAIAALAVVLLAACSSGKKAATPSSTSELVQDTTTSIPTTPVVAKIVSPEPNSVQGSAGKGMVVVLTFTASDPTALPAQFRVGGELPTAASTKPGHNPAFPGLVVGTTTTGAALGGPGANLANLFQIVSPSKQPDGSVKVTAVWTNTQAAFGADADVTLGVVTVSGTAPDVIPQPLTDMPLNSNVASVTFHLSAADAGTAAAAGGSTTTTAPKTSTTAGRVTTTTRRGATTTTVARSTTSTTRPTGTTTTVPATTTTKLLGIF
jgi:hypothetical protein